MIVCRKLSVELAGRDVIDDLSFDLGGGVTCLLGPNGAGKTTLLRTLCGLVGPRVGSCAISGEPAGSLAARLELGYLPQVVSPVRGLRVKDLVAYVAWLQRLSRPAIAEAVERALALTGIEHLAGRPLTRLSGGELRLAYLTQAIVHRPSVLLLDEPTSGLDPAQRVSLRELVHTLAAEHTVLLTTHLVEDVEERTRTVLVLNEGRLAFAGAPSELAAKGEHDGRPLHSLERGFLAVVTSD